MKRILMVLLLPFWLGYAGVAQAEQSTVVISDGMACMGYDKSRKQTEREAASNARQRASEQVMTHVKTETLIKDAEVQSDLMQAFSNATVRIIKEMEHHWGKQPNLGECYYLRIQAEVIPQAEAMHKVAASTALSDPSKPLMVKLWLNQSSYHQGEHVTIYLRGNKPFYGRIVYDDASGNHIQLLPNPYRKEHFFQGGVIASIPIQGRDRFDLEVSPPFGAETITLYASTAPGGDLAVKNAGAVYMVTTKPQQIAVHTRGIKLVTSGGEGKRAKNVVQQAEFAEEKVRLTTAR